MNKQEDSRKELEEISPFLANLKKEQPFKVTKNYFEQLPDQVLDRVQTTQKEAQAPAGPNWLDQLAQSLALLLQPRYALSLATVALVIVATVFMLRSADPSMSTVVAEEKGELSEEVIQDYIAANIEDFEADLLWEMSQGEALSDFDELEGEDLAPYIDEIIDDLDDSDLEELL
ncbi:MAG: hypothetical protein AAFP19_08105 [Bacteroidota bacterium]